jgi:hypothetical protein
VRPSHWHRDGSLSSSTVLVCLTFQLEVQAEFKFTGKLPPLAAPPPAARTPALQSDRPRHVVLPRVTGPSSPPGPPGGGPHQPPPPPPPTRRRSLAAVAPGPRGQPGHGPPRQSESASGTFRLPNRISESGHDVTSPDIGTFNPGRYRVRYCTGRPSDTRLG